MHLHKRLVTALTLATLLAAAGSANAQTVFDFEAETPTYNPPAVRTGALTSLVLTQDGISLTLTRQSAVAFDLVQNTATPVNQLKPASWGNVSLDPFFNTASNNAFVGNFSEEVFSVSLNAGDYGEAGADEVDTVILEAFAGLNATGTLLGSDSFVLPDVGTDFTFDTVSVFAPGIRSIRFIGGSPLFAHSVFYDNIVVNATAPEPSALALLGLGVGLAGVVLRRRSG